MTKPPPYVRVYGDDLHGSSAKDELFDTKNAWPLYCALLLHQMHYGSIPSSVSGIAERIGASVGAVRKAWPMISQRFVAGDDGRLRNPRMEAEIEASREAYEAKVRAGRASASARSKARGKANTVANSVGSAVTNGVGNGVGFVLPTTRTRTRIQTTTTNIAREACDVRDGASGQSEPDSGASRKPSKPAPSPEAASLAVAHEKGLTRYQPRGRHKTDSRASLEAYRRLLETDRRDPAEAAAVMAWLWDGYEPEPGSSFDWRDNIRAGTKFRQHYDRLVALMQRQAKAGPVGRAAIPDPDSYTGAGL